MSLLLEALKKAEKAKQEGQAAAQQGASKAPEFSLEEIAAASPRSATAPEPAEKIAADRLAAEKVFSAKSPSGRNVKLLVGGGGVLAVLVAGGAFYFWQEASRPGITVTQGGAVRPAPVISPAAPKPPPAAEPTRPTPMVTASAPPAAAQPPAATAAATEAAPSVAAPEEAAKEQPAVARRPSAKPEAPGAIKIQRGDAAAELNPQLVSAFQAFSSGDYTTARQNYRGLLQKEPNHRDALLGLAAIAWQNGNHGEAASYYFRVLELDPKDALAHAGLMGIKQGDPAQSESRLKILLTNQPEAGFLHFALGNLYAGQSRWDEAQQSYFHAFSVDPANGDFAFNLAVSLDHLGQNKLAAEYYRRALALATASSGFDRALATQRMRELEQ